MTSSTSSSRLTSGSRPTSSSRPARAFLALFALLVIVVEIGFSALLPQNRGRHEVDGRLAELASLKSIPRTVLISDSLSYSALDTVEAPAKSLDLTSNQAISFAGNAFMLRRLFEACTHFDDSENERIETVYFVTSPTSFDSNIDWPNFVAPYFTDLFLESGDAAEVDKRLERTDLVEAMHSNARRLWAYPPSFLRRGVFHSPLTRFLRAINQWLYADPQQPKEPSARTRVVIEERAAISNFHVSAVTAAFLPRMVELCGNNGTRLVLFPPPIPPSLLEAWNANGYWQEYLDYIAEFAARYGHVSYLDTCPYKAERDGDFYDGVHLDQRSRKEWGQALAELLGD